jgi:hypothetical protein
LESVSPLLEWRSRQQTEPRALGVCVPDEAESIVVESEPEVETVFLDLLGWIRVPSACAFTPQTPADLVDGNVVLLAPIWVVRELESRGYRADSTAQDRNFSLGGFRAFAIWFRGGIRVRAKRAVGEQN